jgi:hypothetical protein
MGQRAAIFMLVTALLMGGVSVCPSPAMACTAQLRSAHRCCQHATLRSNSCCCKDGQRPLRTIGSATTEPPQHLFKRLALAFTTILPTSHALGVSFGASAVFERSLAPPGPPAPQHTVLLL